MLNSMQSYTLQQTLEAVNTLNKPDQPFSYRIEGQQIVGEWKYLDATWAAPLAAGNVDKDFKVTITLNESDHTFSSEDHQTKKSSGVSFSNGTLSFGSTSEGFSGHKTGKEFGFGIGKANQPQNETPVGGPTYQYKFDTGELKKPLFDFLAQTGWKQQEKGLFGKLFGSK